MYGGIGALVAVFEATVRGILCCIQRLHSARHIALLTGTQRILMEFPFSSIVTLSESRWLERTKRALPSKTADLIFSDGRAFKQNL